MKQCRPFPTPIYPNRGSQVSFGCRSGDGNQVCDQIRVRINLYRSEIAELTLRRIKRSHGIERACFVVYACRFDFNLRRIEVGSEGIVVSPSESIPNHLFSFDWIRR